MPTQKELQERLGVGSVTISRAIHTLQIDGIVEVKGKTGVFVRDPEVSGYIGRHVGVVALRTTANLSMTLLAQYIDLELYDSGCQSVRFLRKAEGIRYNDSFEEYAGLKRNMLQQRLDGMVLFNTMAQEVWDTAREFGIPLCYVGPFQLPKNSISIDYDFMISESVRVLAQRGFQRPVLLGFTRPSMIFGKDYIDHLYEVFEAAMAHCFGYSSEMTGTFFMPVEFSYGHKAQETMSFDWIDETIAQLYRLPACKRPDALMIPDDIIANRVYLNLLKLTDWQPEVLSLHSRQIMISAPETSVGHWELDLRKLAHCAIVKLNEMTMNKNENNFDFDPILCKPEWIPAADNKLT